MSEDVKNILERIGLEEANNQIAELRNEIERLRSFQNDAQRLSLRLSDNRKLWTETDGVRFSNEDIHIEDPIHQIVTIEAPITPIYYHPIVQRLAHVKQLSFTYLTFPTATHSRLSHSLGVCRNAELALRSILQKGVVYTNGERPSLIPLNENQKEELLREAKVAALLHDIGHGPFGHGLDQYITPRIKDPVPDKSHGIEIISEYLADAISACELDPNAIIALLGKEKSKLEGYDNLVSEIIDSPLDVDRMDYLVRDAHLTGLSLGTVNVQALIARMIPFEETKAGVTKVMLAFHPSAIPYITHLLYARDSMYLNCYEHPTKMIAEKMLMRAVDAFFSARDPVDVKDLMLLTDEELVRLLLENSERQEVSYKFAFALMQNSLFEEVYSFHPRKRGNVLYEAVEGWRGNRLTYKGKFDLRPKEWEQKIADLAGLSEEDQWKILVTVPSEGMYLRKDDEIRILTMTDERYGYSTWADLTGYWEDVLETIGSDRYCFRVFASPDLHEKRELLYRVAEEHFLAEQKKPTDLGST